MDVVVVGLGVGGEEVAGRLAEAGLTVVGIERTWSAASALLGVRAEQDDDPGGERAGRGASGQRAGRVRRGAARLGAGGEADPRRGHRHLGRQGGGGPLHRQGRPVRRGSGRLDGPNRVRVGDQVFQARYGVVLGTGTRPSVPPIDGLADTPYWTNHQAIEVEELPASLLVLGGGAIGLELAQVFARFGVRVTVIEAADRVLAVEEPEASALAADALRADGVEIHTGVKAGRVGHDGGAFTVYADGAEFTGRAARGDRPQGAPGGAGPGNGRGGRRAALPAGQRPDARHRRDLGTTHRRGAFTHIAMYQAGIVVADVLDHMRRTKGGPDASGTASVVGGAAGVVSAVGGAMSAGGSAAAPGSVPVADYRALPRVTFTDPEVGAVGLTEQQARERGVNVQIGYADLTSSARGWIHKTGNAGFIKLIADADQGVLIGATSAGPAGGEVLSALVVAVHAAVPISQLRHMIYAYPTFHRAISDALRALK
ncbi:FAD-dependent oxidoreductase [Micromonospora sp. BRA006-A]|nr:FAD-dependent oxidoreductase [Micromonospora sp. BRA006-A]